MRPDQEKYAEAASLKLRATLVRPWTKLSGSELDSVKVIDDRRYLIEKEWSDEEGRAIAVTAQNAEVTLSKYLHTNSGIPRVEVSVRVFDYDGNPEQEAGK